METNDRKPPRPNGPDEVKVVDRRWWVRDEGGVEADDAVEELRKPTYVEELEAQLRSKEAALQEYAAKHRAALQEFEEGRLRFRREASKDIERSRRAILVELLDVLDNLDRAIEAARPAGAETTGQLLQGVELVRSQFLVKLESFGVRRMDTEGQPFDPHLHDAVSTVTSSDPGMDGRVTAVIRHGYLAGEEVLRPASVVVATHRSEEAT